MTTTDRPIISFRLRTLPFVQAFMRWRYLLILFIYHCYITLATRSFGWLYMPAHHRYVRWLTHDLNGSIHDIRAWLWIIVLMRQMDIAMKTNDGACKGLSNSSSYSYTFILKA